MPSEKRPIATEQWKKLASDLMVDAEETGVDTTCYGAWEKVV